MIWDVLIGIGVALLGSWLALLIALLIVRPKGSLLGEAVHLLPDLLRRLAADRSLPRGVRIRLGLLMAYLALPIDLIPDFLPVIGDAGRLRGAGPADGLEGPPLTKNGAVPDRAILAYRRI